MAQTAASKADNDFKQLDLPAALLGNLDSLGYSQMTEVQALSLPPILAGKDVMAQAKTGSGKTAAFGLGLLAKLNVKRYRIQSLVLCPTRELADQVAKEIRRLARAVHNIKVLTLCGGMPFGPQIGSLEHGAHIVVGTPGRVEEHVRKGTLKLENVNMLVLDEADRMLDMGFSEALDNIVAKLPAQRQTLLFSATYADEVKQVAQVFLREPMMLEVANAESNAQISQYMYCIDVDGQPRVSREQAVMLLLQEYQPQISIVFANTKRETQELAQSLQQEGFSALALHGDLEQKQRQEILVRFANQSASILVATDVAARGLDIDKLDLVINYHLSRDPEVHVHRVGRTGRGSEQGIACSLYSAKEEFKVERLANDLNQDFMVAKLPNANVLSQAKPQAPMACLQIDAGKKQKLRPGDIMGALSNAKGMTGKQVGKIDIFDFCAYVAVERDVAKAALNKLSNDKIKGRSFRVRRIRG